MDDILRSHAELRAAVRIAGKHLNDNYPYDKRSAEIVVMLRRVLRAGRKAAGDLGRFGRSVDLPRPRTNVS